MSNLLLTVLLASTLLWWGAPRIFLAADARLARQNLRAPQLMADDDMTSAASTGSQKQSASLVELAQLCDSLARSTRGGAAPSAAIIMSLQQRQFIGSHWRILGEVDASGLRAADTLNRAHQSAHDSGMFDDARCLMLIIRSMVHDNFIPAALDHASVVLRDSASCRADMNVAASQARLSARMLTLLPFVLMLGAILGSSSFRSSLASLPVALSLVIGLTLNRFGWRWISRHIARAISEQPTSTEQLTDHFCVSLRAGLTIVEACRKWRNTSPDGARIAHSLANGFPLEEALEPLSSSADLSARTLVDVIVQADRDGLPILSTVNRLSIETRAERRRVTDARIRQLPTRLSVPLVLCVLPSFLFMSIAPLILASLSGITLSLPPVTS